jgi:hypothetical protein
MSYGHNLFLIQFIKTHTRRILENKLRYCQTKNRLFSVSILQTNNNQIKIIMTRTLYIKIITKMMQSQFKKTMLTIYNQLKK